MLIMFAMSPERRWFPLPQWLRFPARPLIWAESLYRRRMTAERRLETAENVLARMIEHFGIDSGPAAKSRDRVAEALEEQGRYQEARLLREQAHAAYARNLGETNPSTLSAELRLAVNLFEHGEHQQALPLAEHVLRTQQQVLGVDHERTQISEEWAATIRDGLADQLEQEGRYEEARPYREQAFDLYERKLGEASPSTLNAEMALAINLYEDDLDQQALPLAEHVLRTLQQLLGSDHEQTQAAEEWVCIIKDSLADPGT